MKNNFGSKERLETTRSNEDLEQTYQKINQRALRASSRKQKNSSKRRNTKNRRIQTVHPEGKEQRESYAMKTATLCASTPRAVKKNNVDIHAQEERQDESSKLTPEKEEVLKQAYDKLIKQEDENKRIREAWESHEKAKAQLGNVEKEKSREHKQRTAEERRK